jgi:hypothetical protein
MLNTSRLAGQLPLGITPSKKNPNTISLTNAYTFKIPLNPVVATTHASPLAAIGVAINGILFNQYAGPNQPLTDEFNLLINIMGTSGTSMYHYHIEPLY